jgi:hypothetical protein
MSGEVLKDYLAGPGLCPNPVFIIGAPRSGTTILAWSLAQHSRLWTSAESDFLFHLFGNDHAGKAFRKATEVAGDRWLKTEKVGRQEFLGFLGLGLNALYTSRSGGRRWVEQTPLYTMIVDVLGDLFPGALFLHILRDGRRVVHSMTHFLQQKAVVENKIPGEFIGGWASDFREACRAWRRYTDRAMDFCAAYPDRSLTVINEQLVADPTAGFGAILRFLGVPYEDGPANLFRSRRINSSFHKGPSRAPAVHELADPWQEWSPEQRRTFADEAGSAMVKYGLAGEKDLVLCGGEPHDRLGARIRRVLRSAMPAGVLAVVSKGDSELLEACGPLSCHFPQADDGEYAGYHPADSREAVEHLEALRARGVQFLLFPAASFWWLDHYRGFREHLDGRYRRLWHDDTCVLYHLLPGQGGARDEAEALGSGRSEPAQPAGEEVVRS